MSLGVNLGNNIPYDVLEKSFLNNLLDYYANPLKYYLEPFQIFGNLYYIGDKKVCCHLLDTGDGLIAFDSGYAHTAHLYIRSIRTLGFNPKDIRLIIHSHGHFDHFGASSKMKDLYGTRLALSRIDAERLQINPAIALMKYAPEPYGSIPSTDYYIDDGDIITMGSTSIRCVSAPGHTEGTMAFFFNATDGYTTHSVGYIGGIGFLSLYRKYLTEYDLPDMQEQMKQTITHMRKESPEISLGNHPNHNGTIEKREYMLLHPDENPFIDPYVWKEMLDALDRRLKDFQAKGY